MDDEIKAGIAQSGDETRCELRSVYPMVLLYVSPLRGAINRGGILHVNKYSIWTADYKPKFKTLKKCLAPIDVGFFKCWCFVYCPVVRDIYQLAEVAHPPFWTEENSYKFEAIDKTCGAGALIGNHGRTLPLRRRWFEIALNNAILDRTKNFSKSYVVSNFTGLHNDEVSFC